MYLVSLHIRYVSSSSSSLVSFSHSLSPRTWAHGIVHDRAVRSRLDPSPVVLAVSQSPSTVVSTVTFNGHFLVPSTVSFGSVKLRG